MQMSHFIDGKSVGLLDSQVSVWDKTIRRVDHEFDRIHV